MSVKIMGDVWDLDNSVIDREEKYVLLAYADHADHNGNNMFPSIALICQKTGYKERAAQMITKSLVEKGFLVPVGKGPKGTNRYSFGRGAISAGVQSGMEGGASSTVNGGATTNAPEPSKPSSSESSLRDKPAPRAKASDLWSNVLYREVTEKYPKKANWHDVLHFMFEVEKRLSRTPTKDDLLPFYKAWTGCGWNEWSINWLEYAVKGVLPGKGQQSKQTEPRAVSAVRDFLSSFTQSEVVDGITN